MKLSKPIVVTTILVTLYLAVWVGFAYLAPAGDWHIRVLNIGVSGENDPGGPYLFSSLELMDYEKTLFLGHPGLTLQYYLYGLMQVGYHLLGSKEYQTIQEFVAHNLAQMFFWAKMSMAMLHLLSFGLLYYFTSIFFEKRTALLATVLYATSFPVMYYFTVISPEPLISVIFLGILILLYKIYNQSLCLNSIAGVAAVAILGMLAVAAVYTKLNLLAPAPLILTAFIFFAGWKQAHHRGDAFYTTLHLPLIFLAGALPLFLIFKAKVDWLRYMVFWRGVLEGNYYSFSPPSDTSTSVAFIQHNLTGMLRDFAGYVVKFVSRNFIYHFRSNNIASLYMLTEWIVILTAAYGFCQYFVRDRERRAFWLWPSIFIIFNLATYIVKPRFNYTFLFQVIFSIFAAYGLLRLIEKYLAPFLRDRMFPVCIALLLMHFTAVYSVLNSRLEDVKMYRSRCLPYYEATHRLEHDHKLGIVYSGQALNPYIPLKLSWDFIDTQAGIIRAIHALYLEINRDELLSIGSKEELAEFIKENKIALILETDAGGQPIGSYQAAGDWLERCYPN